MASHRSSNVLPASTWVAYGPITSKFTVQHRGKEGCSNLQILSAAAATPLPSNADGAYALAPREAMEAKTIGSLWPSHPSHTFLMLNPGAVAAKVTVSHD